MQFPITHCPEKALDFIEAGADDLGDFELSGDERNDALTLNAFKIVRDRLAGAGLDLADRLSLYPAFSTAQWTTPRFQELLGGEPCASPTAQAVLD